jgi:hypothetical protein
VDPILLRNGARRGFLGIVIVINLGLWLITFTAATLWKGLSLIQVVGILLALVLLVKLWRSGTLLTYDGIEVRRPFGARVILWGAISNIAVTETGWGRRVSVHLKSGESAVLAAPGDWYPSKDPNYESSLELLIKYYEAGRARST